MGIRSGRVDRKFEFSYSTDEALALMFKRFYPVTKVADQFAAAIRAKTNAITAADLQQAFIKNMYNSDVQMVEYMERQWDPNAEKSEAEAFEELDRRLKKERAIRDLKMQRKREAAKKAFDKEVEEELKGIDTTVEDTPVESGSDSSPSTSYE